MDKNAYVVSDSEDFSDARQDVLFDPLVGADEVIEDVVPSEDESDAQVAENTVPSDDAQIAEHIASIEEESNTQSTDIDDSIVEVAMDNQERRSSEPGEPIAPLPTEQQQDDATFTLSGRSLRKRTAIQKLPYSLERIKHRQQLQGFDVSNFESVSNEVDLPVLPDHTNDEREDSYTHPVANGPHTVVDDIPYLGGRVDHDSEFSEYLSGNATEDEDSPIVTTRLTHVNDRHDIEEEEGEEEEEEEGSSGGECTQNIMFRGRALNVKTGYRGVLPRSAWMRELEKSEKKTRKPVYRSKKRQLLHKGTAIRKKSKNTNAISNDKLMAELLVDDTEEQDFDRTEYMRQGSHDVGASKLKELDQYYHERYGNNAYSAGPDDNQMDNTSRSATPNNGPVESPEVINIDSDGFMSDPGEDVSSDDGLHSFAPTGYGDISEESNRGIIDSMLSRPERSRGPQPKRQRKKRTPQPRLKRATPVHKRRRPVQVIKTKIIRPKLKGNIPNRSKPAGNTAKPPVNGGEIEQDDNKSQDGKEKTRKKRQSKAPVNSFLTVVEALGNKYSAVTQKIHDQEFCQKNITDLSENAGSPLKILDVLSSSTVYSPPNTIKVKIADKDYIFSRFSGGNVSKTLQEMFDAIINRGSSDVELIECSKSLMEFMYYLNDLSLLTVVQSFHRAFQKRVYAGRSKAKPIHFYELAVCQLMLLEISKFTNIPNISKQNIESEIINNIASLFTLLSHCNLQASGHSAELMYEAYDILASVVDLLKANDKLWDKFSTLKYTPEILSVLCSVFPTNKSYWQIMDIHHRYKDLSAAFKLVKYCIKVCKWKVSDPVILAFNDIFKRRRFFDFTEEEANSEKNFVIRSPTNKFAVGTLFNRYLTMLRSCAISGGLADRIIPMSVITQVDPPSVVVNRINLLIVLAQSVKFNLDPVFSNLIKPLLNNTGHETPFDTRKMEAILNGYIAFLEISASRCDTSKLSSTLNTVYKGMVLTQLNAGAIWLKFVKTLSRHFGNLKNDQGMILKDLREPLQMVLESGKPDQSAIVVVSLMEKHLDLVSTSWLQKTLLPLVKNAAEKSVEWISHYCYIGKYLIDAKVTTWWGFYMYQGLKSTDEVELTFCLALLKMCDENSFGIMKETFFKLATKHFFSNESVLFRSFIVRLLRRTSGVQFNEFLDKYHSNLLFRVKIYFQVLKKLKYSGQMVDLMDSIEDKYSSGKLGHDQTFAIVELLNSNYADEIKNCRSFAILKQKLGISDVETERSFFRDSFRSLKSADDKLFFIEEHIVKSITSSAELDALMQKLKPLFEFRMGQETLVIFRQLIEMNITNENRDLGLLCPNTAAILLRVINDNVSERFYQVDKGEFSELLMIGEAIIIARSMGLRREGPKAALYVESLRLIKALLVISQGWPEWETAADMCERFFALGEPAANQERHDLPYRIAGLLDKSSDLSKSHALDVPASSDIESLQEVILSFLKG